MVEEMSECMAGARRKNRGKLGTWLLAFEVFFKKCASLHCTRKLTRNNNSVGYPHGNQAEPWH